MITNQSGVARGYMTEELVNDVHDLLLQWCDQAGVAIDSIEYCPHHPDGAVPEYSMVCDCRKPAPGMLNRASEKLGIDLTQSYVVGDKLSDIGLGPAVGAKAIIVRTGFGERQIAKMEENGDQPPDYIADGIGDAVEWILNDVAAER